MKIDRFTQLRLTRFIDDFRARNGQFPTLADLAAQGFAEALVDSAERAKLIERVYVTLTNGTIVKGYKTAV